MEKTEEVGQAVYLTFKSGLTRTSILATLYAIFVFIPALIYLTLMTGGIAGVPVAWFTLLLWIELGKLSGIQITKQEAYMILIITGAEMLYPLGMVYNAWYRASDIAQLLNISPYIPDWFAPAPQAGILELRTFFNPSWALPITVSLIGTLFALLANFGLGLFAREVFIETEKLPFPIQQISGEALIVLTGKEERPIDILAVFAVAGFIYGFILYAFPFIFQAYTGTYMQTIPIPWVDLNERIEAVFPGACFGVATDLSPIASGLVLSFPTVLGIFIGSMAIWFFGNWLSVMQNLVDINLQTPEIESWWTPRMSISLAYQRSMLYFWFAILIGIALAVGIAPILRRPGLLRRAFSSMVRPHTRERERLTDPISFTKVTLPLTVAGLVGGIILFTVLVPNFVQVFPWIIPMMIALPFISTLVLSRMIGEAGIGSFPVGHLQNLLYYSSGYKGVDVWFASNPMTNSGDGILTWLKVAELTETTASSVIKTYWLFLPVAIAVGYFYVELFWKLAPIPSGRYPGVAIFWPVSATMQSLWIRGGAYGLFNPMQILYAFIAGTGIYLALDFVHSPITLVALGVGTGTITPIAVTMLIGAIIAKIFSWRLGKEWWNKHRLLSSAGLLLGEGIAVVIAVSIALILNSIWTLPI